MSVKVRRHWTAEEKLQIIEEARQTEHTVSEVCQRHGLAVGQFYRWEKQARQGALKALHNRRRGRKRPIVEAHLRAEVERLRAVVTELSAENLQLKKGLWP